MVLVIILTTPATASEPYTADAPSLSTSMRSIAASGIVFKSTAESAPVPEFTILRPFTKTKVRLMPSPRKLIRAAPAPPLLVAAPVAIPLEAVLCCNTCSTDVKPPNVMSCALMIDTGLADSRSVRLMREPVI